MSDVILRKFWLENETGESIPLNGERGLWLINPTGLGMTYSTTYTDFGYGVFKPVEAYKDPQQTIAGDLYFIDEVDPYTRYRNFSDWIARAKELYLVYSPTPVRYRRKIRLESLTKTELLTQECLKCPIAMYTLGPWFTKTTYKLEVESDRLAYPWIVNVSRVSKGDEDDKSTLPRLLRDNSYHASVDVYSDSQLDSGFILQYTGAVVNPTIVLRATGGSTIYGRCALAGTSVATGETFQYRSLLDDSGIIKIGQYGETDLINYVTDLSYDIYPKIPPRTPVTIEMYAANELAGTLNVEMVKYYKGV